MAESKDHTHTAFAMKRLTKSQFAWLEIGTGRLDSKGVFHGFLDRMPIGGFTGYVYFAPIGQKPPDQEAARPDSAAGQEQEMPGVTY